MRTDGTPLCDRGSREPGFLRGPLRTLTAGAVCLFTGLNKRISYLSVNADYLTTASRSPPVLATCVTFHTIRCDLNLRLLPLERSIQHPGDVCCPVWPAATCPRTRSFCDHTNIPRDILILQHLECLLRLPSPNVLQHPSAVLELRMPQVQLHNATYTPGSPPTSIEMPIATTEYT